MQVLSGVGCGVPDIVCSRWPLTFFVEIKDGSKPPSARTLTTDQVEWLDKWAGLVFVVTSAAEAVNVANHIVSIASRIIKSHGQELQELRLKFSR